MCPINPTSEQFSAFAASDDEVPFVMVNLLKFAEMAAGGSGSGRDAYRRYSENVAALLDAVGGKVVWAGSVEQLFIGTAADEWDYVLLVQYPSKSAFLEMVSSEKYAEIQQDREKGLEKTALLKCMPFQPI